MGIILVIIQAPQIQISGIPHFAGFYKNSPVWRIGNFIKSYKMGNILEIIQVPQIQIPHFAGFYENSPVWRISNFIKSYKMGNILGIIEERKRSYQSK